MTICGITADLWLAHVADELLEDLGDCLMKIHLLRCVAGRYTGHYIDLRFASERNQTCVTGMKRRSNLTSWSNFVVIIVGMCPLLLLSGSSLFHSGIFKSFPFLDKETVFCYVMLLKSGFRISGRYAIVQSSTVFSLPAAIPSTQARLVCCECCGFDRPIR